MPITKLTPGATFRFTTTSGSTETVAFAGGTETPFNYVFRNGIVTGISNITSGSNPAYNIQNYTSIDNSGELFNRGTYRYSYLPIDSTTTSSISFTNQRKQELVENGSLVAISGSDFCQVYLPTDVHALSGTCMKIIRTGVSTNSLVVRTAEDSGIRFKGNLNSPLSTLTQGTSVQSSTSYATIELISTGEYWLVTSVTGDWLFVVS